MEVKLLSITHYKETGWGWHNEEIECPTWAQIEEGIRRLNKFRRPFIKIALGDDAPEAGYLSVVGGDGVYSLSAELGNSFPSYYDASKSDAEIAVWTSDQGYYPEEKYVCYDLELVLKIAHHYAQFGELSPAVVWQ